ncbi:MAG: hypothetical protein AB1646_24880 [Thermodesulfobacteriota bacterium]
MKEEHIENLVRGYPGLFGIDPSFPLLGSKYGKKYFYPDSTIPDALFRDDNKGESVVVEIKDDPLKSGDLQQLRDYLEQEHLERPAHNIRGVLVGLLSTVIDDLDAAMADLPWPVEIKCLVRDFSMSVRICDQCSNAYWPRESSCPRCRNTTYHLVSFDQDR